MATQTSIPRNYTFSEEGTLIYIPVGSDGQNARTLVWVDREGNEEPIPAPPRAYRAVRISPDGTRLTGGYVDQSDIWIYEFDPGKFQRFTFDPAPDYYPIWSHDGQRILFVSGRGDESAIYAKQIDGASAPELLISHPDYPFPQAMTPDGSVLVYGPAAPLAPVSKITLGADGTPEVLLEGKFSEKDARFSPDGRWISYTSHETGRLEVVVQTFPALDARWQVSTEGGEDLVWNPDGTEVFYWQDDQLMVVDIDLDPTFSAGAPRPLFSMPSKIPTIEMGYDISPDGERFVVIKAGAKTAWALELIVVENWFEELRRLAPPYAAERGMGL